MNHFSFMLNLVQMPNQFLLITIIGIIASFIGTLAGGAALITLPVMMLMGIPVQTSIATNKFSSGLVAFSSVMYLLRHKSLSMKMVLLHVLIAFTGDYAGHSSQLMYKKVQCASFRLFFCYLPCF